MGTEVTSALRSEIGLGAAMGTEVSTRFTGTRPSPSRLLLFLTALPMTLAALAFVLQWRGGVDDPASQWLAADANGPGTDNSPWSSSGSSTPSVVARFSSDCTDILSSSSSPSFPYYRGWKFDFDKDLKPKICITTSTSAGLEQIIPWLYYHKIIGVSQFILFVEGKAVKHHVSAVLESIPGVKVIYRTKELEKQVKRIYARALYQMTLSPQVATSINQEDIKS